MSKYKFLKSKNILPVHKLLTLKYEDGTDEIKNIDIKVYPYNVEEKLEIQNLTEEAQALSNDKDEKAQEKAAKIYEDIQYKSVYYIMKKDDPTIEEDQIQNMPNDWYNDIIYTALEFEGVTKEQLEDASKKEINKPQM